MKNTTYLNGEPVPFARAYQDNEANAEIYGLLYTWESSIGICPAGWRVPTAEEWALLKKYDATKLKTAGYWIIPNSNTNLTELGISGAGFYNSNTQRFEDLTGYTAFWSADSDGNMCTCGVFNYYCNQVELLYVLKTHAVSVRCVME
jgi:uncharacterized protein (TIGR02145 family)